MGKRELKQDMAIVEERVRQHLRMIEIMTNEHQSLLEAYHGVREGTWVTGTSSTGNVWYGPVVEIDWTGASTKVQPSVKIRAHNSVSGNVGMRYRVLHSWKLAKAPKVAA
jgi:hypothetical protein